MSDCSPVFPQLLVSPDFYGTGGDEMTRPTTVQAEVLFVATLGPLFEVGPGSCDDVVLNGALVNAFSPPLGYAYPLVLSTQ